MKPVLPMVCVLFFILQCYQSLYSQEAEVRELPQAIADQMDKISQRHLVGVRSVRLHVHHKTPAKVTDKDLLRLVELRLRSQRIPIAEGFRQKDSVMLLFTLRWTTYRDFMVVDFIATASEPATVDRTGLPYEAMVWDHRLLAGTTLEEFDDVATEFVQEATDEFMLVLLRANPGLASP